jgi:hypothetical protein
MFQAKGVAKVLSIFLKFPHWAFREVLKKVPRETQCVLETRYIKLQVLNIG